VSETIHPKPAIVFVDDVRWESFTQLAAIVRKAGFRTVRVSVGPSGWRAERLLFDRNVMLPLPPTPEELSEILSSELVIDVHPTESLAMTTYAALDLLPSSRHSKNWSGRARLLDKWHVAELLSELGLRTPEALLADATSPSEAVSLLSLPIVLKRRVGSSGSSVNVFNSLESLEAFVANLERPGDWLFERFVQGRSLSCASCVSEEGVDLIATYEIVKRIYVRGPSSVVEFERDPKLTASGQLLFTALNIRGLACFDVIRDEDDIDWIHDVNVRVFGGIATCQLVGFDFRSAYVRFLLGSGRVEPKYAEVPRTLAYGFPDGRRYLFRSARHGFAFVRTLQWIWRNCQLLGSRYFLFFVLERPISLWLRTRGRSGSRRAIG
jgi:hypothetical protein